MRQPADPFDAFWQHPPAAALSLLKSTEGGLTQAEAARRLIAQSKMEDTCPHG